jgi:glycosyltransferase involved in cell wall biosynthesis
MGKKILYLVNVDWFFISHRLPIAEAAKKLNYEIHIATKLTSKKEKLISNGFKVHELNLERKSENIFGLITYLIKVIRIFHEIKPDIVHCITIKPILIGGLASFFFKRIRMVYAISGLGHVYSSNGLKAKIRRYFVDLIYKLIFSKNNFKIIFQNQFDKKCLEKISKSTKKKSFLINGSGIDLNEYYPIKEIQEGMPILFASRLLRSKGIIEFIKAAKSINKDLFLIAGSFDSDSDDSVSRLEMQNLLQNTNIKYLGEIENMSKLINDCSVVVLPSYYGEGLPKILIEAAGCGRPTITTNNPGCVDAIKNNESGFLIPIKNETYLANAMEKLINNPTLCKKMGKASRQLAIEKYDINKVIKKHLAIYKSFNI